MRNKRYPQEEHRRYLTNNKYLLIRSRYGTSEDNNMSASDFARNIWLVEGGNIIWRVQSDIDEDGEPFRYLWTTYSDFLAIRQTNGEKYDNNTWLLDMATGKAIRYTEPEEEFRGEMQQLYIKRETRIYLDDESYILLVIFPGCNNFPRNVSRISATGEEIWKISATPEIDKDLRYIYGSLRILKDGTIVASVDERVQFSVDIETGKATPGLFF